MKNSRTRKIAFCSLFTALVAVTTLLIQIPIPITGGYVNFGDSFIFLAAMLFGGSVGGIAGGVGGALADLISGFAIYAPFTLIIKFLDGLMVGLLYRFLTKKPSADALNNGRLVPKIAPQLSMLVGGFIMVLGYYFTDAILTGSFVTAIGGLLSNSIQFLVSMIVASILKSLVNRYASKFFL